MVLLILIIPLCISAKSYTYDNAINKANQMYSILQKLGYDISNIQNVCESNSPAIYFDINNEFAVSYEEEPIQIILDCYKIK